MKTDFERTTDDIRQAVESLNLLLDRLHANPSDLIFSRSRHWTTDRERREGNDEKKDRDHPAADRIADGMVGMSRPERERRRSIRQYVLEYPPPPGRERPAVEAMIRVERFSADRMFMGQAMLYRQGPLPAGGLSGAPLAGRSGGYGHGISPARSSRGRVFSVRFSRSGTAEDVRYSLTGGVEEFIENRECEEPEGPPRGDDHAAGSLPEGDGSPLVRDLPEDLPAEAPILQRRGGRSGRGDEPGDVGSFATGDRGHRLRPEAPVGVA